MRAVNLLKKNVKGRGLISVKKIQLVQIKKIGDHNSDVTCSERACIVHA